MIGVKKFTTIPTLSLPSLSLSCSSTIKRTTGNVGTNIRNGLKRTYHNTTRYEKPTSIKKDDGKVVTSVGGGTTTVVETTTVTTTTTGSSNWKTFPKRYPFVFQLIVATIKTVAADLTTQIVAEGKTFNDIDWKRNGIFVIFGFVYLGGFQYWLMVYKYRQWFPTMDKFAAMTLIDKFKYTPGIIDAIKMVLFDVCIHLPWLYFPTYYTVKEFVSGTNWSPIDWAYNGISKYSNNIQADLTAMIQVWGPADCIQFVLPVYMRLPFRHFISFFWTAYVSFTRGAIINIEEITLIDE